MSLKRLVMMLIAGVLLVVIGIFSGVFSVSVAFSSICIALGFFVLLAALYYGVVVPTDQMIGARRYRSRGWWD